MTVEITQSAFAYTGDGTQASFPTPFFANDQDIYASLRPLQGASVLLQLGSQYTLTGAGQPLGGTLTIIDASVLPSGSTSLFITTNAIENQLRDFGRVGSIDNREYTRGLDKLTMLVQEVGDGVRRSLHAPLDDLAGDMVLPLEYLRASKFQSYDSTGKPLLYSAQALADLLAPYISGDFIAKTLPKSREELGLQGDSFTDDSVALRKNMLDDSAAGGATYFLQPQDGRTFYFRNRVAIPSNINLIFSGLGVSLGKFACIGTAGDLAFEQPSVPYRLISDHAAGSTRLFVDTGQRGGGLVSTHFPVGTRIAINGFRDGCGNPDRGEYLVTLSDDTSITLDHAIPLALPVVFPDADYHSNWGVSNYTEILKILSVSLAVDGATGQNFVTISPPGFYQPQIGDWVELVDDKTTDNEVAGATLGLQIHLEIFQVVGLNDAGPNTVSLNRRLEHTFETAFGARLMRLDPCQGASVSGCSVVFTEAPTVSIPTFRFDRSVGCLMLNSAVRNEDQFGSLGPMFQYWQSLDCTHVSPVGRNPKSVIGGAGVGLSFLHSSGCIVQEPDISGCRHNLLFASATQCHAIDCLLGDDRVSSVQFLGAGEVGCTVSLRSITGGGRFAPDAPVRRAVRFGLPEGMVGPYRCLVEDGRIAQYNTPNTAAVEFCAGSEECRVTSAMDDVQTAVWCEDSPLNSSRLSKKNAVISTVNGYGGWLVDIDGGRNLSPVKTVQDIRLELRAFDGSHHIALKNADGVRVRVEIDKVTVDPANPHGLFAINVSRLMILRSDFTGVRAGIYLRSCFTPYIVKCLFIDFSGGTSVLDDDGSNPGLIWRSNDILGFAGTFVGVTPPDTGPGDDGLFIVKIT